MIEVNIVYCKSNIISFTVTGHAGYAPEGEDICCAGVSAVTQTALLGLLKHLSRPPVYKVEKGIIKCELPFDLQDEDMKAAQIILSTMEAGLLSMADSYEGYLRVCIRRCE